MTKSPSGTSPKRDQLFLDPLSTFPEPHLFCRQTDRCQLPNNLISGEPTKTCAHIHICGDTQQAIQVIDYFPSLNE